MEYDVIGICTAYEQGYGHGYDQRNLQNPYREKSETWMAWDYGYGEGNRKRIDDDLRKPYNAKHNPRSEAESGYTMCY